MIKKGLLLICVVLTITGCGLFGSAPPAPPDPTLVAIEFDADGDINPDGQGRPSPLVIWIYELESYDEFNDADYGSLVDNDAAVLGGGRLERHEIIIQPNEKKTKLLKDVSEEAEVIGFMGQFRNRKAKWRAATAIEQHKTTVIKVHVGAASLTSKLQDTQ